MENIFSIVICDFAEKIHFLDKMAIYDYERVVKVVKSLNKSLSANYLKEHISKGIELRNMDTIINSKLRVKISIAGEVIVYILYDGDIDINVINITNQRLLDALYIVAKTKKIRIEYLNKKHSETIAILADSLYFIDPCSRFNVKNGIISSKDFSTHSIAGFNYNKTGNNCLKMISFQQGWKEFNTAKNNVDNNKTLRSKLSSNKLSLNDDVVNNIKIKRNIHLSSYGIKTDPKFILNPMAIKKEKKAKASIVAISKKPEIEEIDFTVLGKSTRLTDNLPLHKNENLFNSTSNPSHRDSSLSSLQVDVSKFNSTTERKISNKNDPKAASALSVINNLDIISSIDFDKILKESQTQDNQTKNTDNLIDFTKNHTPNKHLNSMIIPQSKNGIEILNLTDTNRKSFDISHFDNLLQLGNENEDNFDTNLIKKQVRGVIIV